MLSLTVPSRHAVLYDPGESVGCQNAQFHCRRRWPSSLPNGFGTPNIPAIRFKRGINFEAESVRLRYGLSSGLPPWRIRPDAHRHQADGDVYARASSGSVTLPAAGYNYGGNWAISTGGTFTRWNSS